MKKLLDYIMDNYDEGEPILLKDLKSTGISYDNLRQKLKKLTDSNYLLRLSDGIYCYGKEPSVMQIIENRFIKRNNKVFGYYTKNSFLNRMGLDVDDSLDEIITNDFKAIVREIEVLGVRVKVRHSKIDINNENCYTLQLLDLLKDLDDYELSENKLKKALSKFVSEHKICKKEIDKYINLYPNVTFKNYYKYNIENILI